MAEPHLLRQWYKNAIIYCLDVETFQDSNGDGIGDFHGLMQRLDYLSGLGVTCVWLMPFYPTPNRDNGYDVKDYFGVDPRLGDLGDFIDFMHRARERGIRVIIDLVVNHTSIDHPWFQAARSSPDSPFRDYYVWKKERPADAEEGVIFPGYQTTTWTYDRRAKAYYFHRFYDHQAELNIANPRVRDEIRKVMAYWLELGVSGFRVDAAPFLIELKGLENVDVEEPYDYLTELRNYLSWYRGDAVLLAEANIPMDLVPDYFGHGEKLQMIFNFVLNQHLMLSLVEEDASAIREGLYQMPRIPSTCQWGNFLRNHDELSLDRLSDSQREEIFKVFAPEKGMRIYERGIRRRLPPMLKGDQKRIELAHSLLFTLPGTPVLRYGEEIGMGDDLSLDERNSIRTPMQWSGDEGGGFSEAPPDQFVRPMIDRGPFRHQEVNVVNQERDPDSLLGVTEKMIRTRKENREFGFGEWRLVETGSRQSLALRYDWQGATLVVVHNLSSQSQSLSLDAADKNSGRLQELLSDDEYEVPADIGKPIQLGPYGYRWFRVVEG